MTDGATAAVGGARAAGAWAQAALVLLGTLFLTIIVGHVLHTRQVWLPAVFLGLFLLSRRDMKRPLFALAFAMPFLQFGVRPETYTISPTLEVVLLALFVLWFVRAFQGRASLPERGPVDASVLLFLGVATGSALAATCARVWTEGLALTALSPDLIVFQTPPLSPLFPVRQWFVFLEALLLFGFVRANLKSEDVKTLALALLGSALPMMVIAGLIFVKVDRSAHFNGMNRATGLFTGPNQFGTYLLLILPLTVAVVCTDRRWRARGLALLVAGSGIPLLFFSHSEGAWIGAIVAPLLAGSLLGPLRTWPVRVGRGLLPLALLGVGAWGVVLLVTKSPEALNRLSDGRYYLFRSALEMVRNSPLVGVGLGNFYQDLGGFYPEGISGREVHEQAHNMYLQLFTELGPLGLMAFVLPIATLLARAVRWRGATPLRQALVVGVMAVLLHSLTDYTLWVSVLLLLFWMYLGALAVLVDASDSRVQGIRSP